MVTHQKSESSRKSMLPSGCVMPRLNSLFVSQATRGAGQSLHEILGIAELIRVAFEKGDMETVQHRLEVLLPRTADLSNTVSGIIELSRLETQPVPASCVTFDITALMDEVAQRTRDTASQKKIAVMNVSSSSPVFIYSDRVKIRQIMTTLADNAVIFTDRGRIALILNKDKNSIELVVTDTGRGMTPEQIAGVFDGIDCEYDGAVSGYGRSGLGLRIVKHLVKSLNGEMSISSKVGEGTIVQVSLPFLQSGEKASAASAAPV